MTEATLPSKEEAPYLVWLPSNYDELTEDESEYYYSDMLDDLTILMQRINPDELEWHATVENFGWMHQSGVSDFNATTGEELLRKTLPKTDCSFKIYDDKTSIRIDNAHHDKPCGGEIYVITPKNNNKKED
jgi:hypothetical protein